MFQREERGKAIGIWAGMASIGVGLGRLFGGLLPVSLLNVFSKPVVTSRTQLAQVMAAA